MCVRMYVCACVHACVCMCVRACMRVCMCVCDNQSGSRPTFGCRYKVFPAGEVCVCVQGKRYEVMMGDALARIDRDVI